MRKLLMGCLSILSAVIILSTGFIVSALKSIRSVINDPNRSFEYSLFNIELWWFIIPVILLIAGFWLIYNYDQE